MESIGQIIYYKDHSLDFLNNQTEKVKEKIDYVLFVITVTERVPKKALMEESLTFFNGIQYKRHLLYRTHLK
jgi:hypothetical protein